MRYTFDGTAVAPNEGGAEHWPAGNYPVVAVANAYKATAGVPPGERLTYKVQCIDGPLKGKINYIGFNVVNASETAQRIAKEQLSAMSWAVGKPRWQDTDELHNIPFVVTVQWTD